MNPLLALHNAIAAVCPITGVADNGDGTYTVRYDPSATATQQSAAQAAVAAWPLAWQKLQAQALVSQWDSQQRAAGISVTAPAGETITLLADADSQNLIVGGVAMLNNEEVLQPAHIATIEATNISQIFGAPLWLASGSTLDMTAAQFRASEPVRLSARLLEGPRNDRPPGDHRSR